MRLDLLEVDSGIANETGFGKFKWGVTNVFMLFGYEVFDLFIYLGVNYNIDIFTVITSLVNGKK